MAVDTSTKTEVYWGGTQGSAWLSAGESGAPNGARSGSGAQGWSDANVAAVLFNVECDDSYIAAFLLNLRSGGRA